MKSVPDASGKPQEDRQAEPRENEASSQAIRRGDRNRRFAVENNAIIPARHSEARRGFRPASSTETEAFQCPGGVTEASVIFCAPLQFVCHKFVCL